MKKTVLLCILDGFGENPTVKGNAVKFANKPNMDKLFSSNPLTFIDASGMAVGLPDGQMGNSEVGHTNIGAGRVVYQELTRITKEVADGTFFENAELKAVVQSAIDNGTALHLMGLLSDGGVHSHNTHLWALIELAKRMGLEKVYVHCILDGRDVPPRSGADYVKECAEKLAEIGVGKIATVMGRFYAMDRDNRWERVSKAYNAMVCGEGEYNPDPVGAVEKSYEQIDETGKNLTDEFVLPVICEKGAEIGANDSIIFFNFRPDRAREITRSFVDADFNGFERRKGFFPVKYVCMTRYDAAMPNTTVAFLPQSFDNTLGEYLAKLDKKQLRIAETEKYAHVTFFFNSGVETVYEGEDRVLIPSPKVATYDMQPEMSAPEVTERVIEEIRREYYDLIVLNYANCDMVGHTGVFDAAVKAVETVDSCVGRVWAEIEKIGGSMIITADHGNADKMSEEDGTPFTAHTNFPVPFAVLGYDCALRSGGRLCDIAPTILDIMGIEKPAEMSGESLIAK